MRGSQSRRSGGAGSAANDRAGEEARPLDPTELRTLGRDALRAVAKRLGLSGVSSLKKETLLERVLDAVRGGPTKAGPPAKAPPPASPAASKAAPKPAAPAKPPAETKRAAAAKPGAETRRGAAAKPVAGTKPAAGTTPAEPKPAADSRPAADPKPPGPATRAPAPASSPAAAPRPPRPPLVEERRVPIDAPVDSEDEPAAKAKLDLGPLAAKAEKAPATIPWSYGQDRVTAAAIDPARLFVYWEVTDPAIVQARASLGEGGADAWLNLRVYDTTGRIFDGTNAHSYFDHGIGRDDRQWFFHIGKPASSAYVELGMKSRAGHFVKIARTSRVDFPRSAPVQDDAPEWLTVRVSTGEAFSAGRGGGQGLGRAPGPGPGHRHPAGAIPVIDLGAGAAGHEGFERRIWQLLHGEGHRIEWEQLLGGAGWFQLEGHVEWEGPAQITRWEAGPFSYPVSVDPPSREEWEGQSFAFRVGEVTHVVYGPWQVVIRNLGAFSERAEVARWEVFRSWVSSTGREVRVLSRPGAVRPGGASEALGASERRWLAGSELRLGGASEVFRLGASEIRMRGASETLFAGASQWVARGASERRLGGASEVRLRGASERRLGGASESRLGGASESRLGGASEGRLGAGSEGRLGASEHRLAPDGAEGAADAASAAPLRYPKVEE